MLLDRARHVSNVYFHPEEHRHRDREHRHLRDGGGAVGCDSPLELVADVGGLPALRT